MNGYMGIESKQSPHASYGKRWKGRRKIKSWGQLMLGTIAGLLLGLMTELNVFIGGGVETNTSCILPSTNRGSLASSQKLVSSKFNEDPLEVIGWNDSHRRNHGSVENLIFVGVMTAEKYLTTRAVAVYETWGRELPGKIAFFSSETSTPPENRKDLPLVRLKNVDDSYPPQKKSFMMLQYMWENYGDKFEWFVRADDDVYMRPDKMEIFLRSLDSRKPLFIGQAGRGNQEEFGLLSLEYDENFCMGGPGIILSRETLRRVAPNIRYCLKNLYTTHEDVELGRCVRKFADVSCTWSYEMQTILYHNSSGHEAFAGNLKQKEVNRAITLHPVKQYRHMYRVHYYMRHLKIEELLGQIISLQRDLKKSLDSSSEIEIVSKNLKIVEESFFQGRDKMGKIFDEAEKNGFEPSLMKFKASNENELIHWDFIQRSLYSADTFNPRRRMEKAYREGIEDVIRDFMETVNKFSRQRGRVIEYQDLLYGYARLDPLNGADFILDLLLKYKKYRGRKMTVPVRRHVYLQRQFSGIEIRESNATGSMDDGKSQPKRNFLENVLENSLAGMKTRFSALSNLRNWAFPPKRKIVNFILPLSGRLKTFLRFIGNYEEVCLKRDPLTSLFVILFDGGEENSGEKTIERIESLRKTYPKSLLKVVRVGEDFARATALEIGSRQCPEDEFNILFFVDVDMVFDEETVDRIRLNTIPGKQAYFPIVFSEFDPSVVYGVDTAESPDHRSIRSNTGYWRQFGFGIASMFPRDLKTIGGYNTTIRGWGKEDVDVFDRFVSFAGNVTIFRAADPGLVHVFHLVECSPELEEVQLKMCRGTRKDTYGSVQELANFLNEHPAEFRKAAANKKAKTREPFK